MIVFITLVQLCVQMNIGKSMWLIKWQPGLKKYKFSLILHQLSLMLLTLPLFMEFQLFKSRTIPDIQSLMQPLEDTIHQFLIPALTGWPPCSKTERDILALPSRWLRHPEPLCQLSVIFSCFSHPLVNLILAQNLNGSVDFDQVLEAKNIRNSNHLREICLASELESVLSTDQKRKISLTKKRDLPPG